MKKPFIVLIFFTIGISISFAENVDSVNYNKPPLELQELFKFRQSRIVEPVSNLMPHYPKKAYEENVEADVWTRFRLKNKQIDSIEVLHCSVDSFGFEDAAMEWVSSRKFLFQSNVRDDDFDWWYTKLEFTCAKWHWNLLQAGLLNSQKKDSSVSSNRLTEVDFKPVEEFPQLTYKPRAAYPERANKASLGGQVYVRVLVSEKGFPLDVRVTKSCDPDWQWGFNEAAIEGAMKCRFKPAIQDGKPVKVWVSFPFEFSKLGNIIR